MVQLVSCEVGFDKPQGLIYNTVYSVVHKLFSTYFYLSIVSASVLCVCACMCMYTYTHVCACIVSTKL